MNTHSQLLSSLDLNQAPVQLQAPPLIPVGTVVKVMLHIQPGSFGENGWLTRSPFTGSVYLKVQLKIVEGDYKNRIIYERIGLLGTKTDENGDDRWGTMGRSQLRAIIESAYGISPKDQSETAQKRRHLSGFQALNGLVFAIKVGKEKKRPDTDTQYNTMAKIITPDMADYRPVMGNEVLLANEGAQDAVIADFYRDTDAMYPSESPAAVQNASATAIPTTVQTTPTTTAPVVGETTADNGTAKPLQSALQGVTSQWGSAQGEKE